MARLRAAPNGSSEQVTQALQGEPLVVLERRDGWARVRTAYDYRGWIREDELGGRPDDAWAFARGGDPVAEAQAFLGTPYEWGGLTEHGIDCSGLVHIAYRRTGRLVPRDAHEQEAAATAVAATGAKRGDLVCFGTPGAAHHIAFWLGEGRILHATERDGLSEVLEEPLANVDATPVRFVRL